MIEFNEIIKQLKPYYHNENVILFHGDCLEILKLFPDNFIDIRITSPPYNFDNTKFGWESEKNGKYYNNDDCKTIKEYTEFIFNSIDILLKKVKWYIFYNIMDLYTNDKISYKIIKKYSDYIKNNFINIKKNSKPGYIKNKKYIKNSYENIFCFINDKNKAEKRSHLYFNNNKCVNNFIITGINNNKYSKLHQAAFNPEIPRFFIKHFTKKNSIILDCFAGIGTTGIECLKYNRKCILIEKEEKYCDIIIKRIKHKIAEKNNEFYIPEEEMDLFNGI